MLKHKKSKRLTPMGIPWVRFNNPLHRAVDAYAAYLLRCAVHAVVARAQSQLLLQSGQVQAGNIPLASLALAVEHEGAQVAEFLLASSTAQEGLDEAVIHPLLELQKTNPASADLGVQVKVHVEGRVPPLSQDAGYAAWVGEAWASGRLEVIDESGEGGEESLAAPAWDASRDNLTIPGVPSVRLHMMV